MLKRLFLAAMMALSGGMIASDAMAQSNTRTYAAPKLGNYRLDWCRTWATNCGKPAADMFCRRRGYQRAIRWRIAPNIGSFAPTRVIATGQICNQPGCDGFRFVTCQRRVVRDRTFRNPRLGRYRLDWCRRWAQGCGRPAAVAYCRRRGFRTAVRWRIAPNIGTFAPTRIISTGQICRDPGCDGFRFITCRGRR